MKNADQRPPPHPPSYLQWNTRRGRGGGGAGMPHPLLLTVVKWEEGPGISEDNKSPCKYWGGGGGVACTLYSPMTVSLLYRERSIVQCAMEKKDHFSMNSELRSLCGVHW